MTHAEEWRSVPIAGAEGYEVSNLGRVRSIGSPGVECDGDDDGPRGDPRLLRADREPNGYLSVRLAGRASFHVHRLVLTAFVGPPPAKRSRVAHLNGDPSDNRLANLCWVPPRNSNVRGPMAGRSRATLERGERVRGYLDGWRAGMRQRAKHSPAPATHAAN